MKFVLQEKELSKLVKNFLEQFPKGVVILKGDLAAGKTTLVKEFAKQKGSNEAVTSPTFALQQIYAEDIFHYDLYNKGLEHFLSLGMLEEFEKDGLHFVEWGDARLQKLLSEAGLKVATIEIVKCDFDSREYNICIH